MACISRAHTGAPGTPDPRRWSNNEHPRMQRMNEEQMALPTSTSTCDPPRKNSKTNTPRRVVSTSAAAAATSFHQAVKSPISHCIDTIIGAAEVLAKRDFDGWQMQISEGEAEAEPVPSSRHVSSHHATFDRFGQNQPQPVRKVSAGESVFMHPLEELLEDDKELQKQLILTMAMQRPRTLVNPHPTKPPSTLIGEGFYWKEYPLLEEVLYEHMEEYYDWSTRERQSKQQQAFNNALVNKVRAVALEGGNSFCPTHFTDKRLRDRIRCFYKTHLQNAKKRLHTMKKHIDTDEKRQALQSLIDKARTHSKGGYLRLLPTVSSSDSESDSPKTKKRQRFT